MPVADPTMTLESELHRAGHRYVIGCDEVGRGAIAGPVAVGVAVVDVSVGAFPAGLRDSKLLSEKRRESIAPLARAWARTTSVGLATAAEIDQLGLSAALGLAGARAIRQLDEAILADAIVLLDGHFDWLNPAMDQRMPLRTAIKADRDCASVAAASVVAKVHRDGMMIAAHDEVPHYGWVGNKGYGSAAHFEAISLHGPSDLHRHTWLRAPTA